MKRILFFVIIIFVFGIGTYYFFNNNYEKKAHIKFVGSDKVTLKIDNSSPISDELGIKKDGVDDGYQDFSIKSFDMNKKSSKYEIYVKQINSINSINGDYIKLYLSEKNTNRPLTKVLVFGKLNLSTMDMDSRKLYVGTIKKGETINLNLKMWLSDNYTISNEKRNFEIILGVRIVE